MSLSARSTFTIVLLISAMLTGAAGVAETTTTKFPVSKLSNAGLYRVTLEPVPASIPIADLHAWTVRVETAEGKTFAPIRLGINGGMPAHGHGMISEPRITHQLRDGEYLIEGMKFHMGGSWRLTVGLEGPDGFDKAIFDMTLLTNPEQIDRSIRSWSSTEIAILQSLTLERLPPAADRSNRFSGNADAAALGSQLFDDKSLSASQTVSCATCHQPELAFTDGLAKSFGTAETQRNAPTLIGVSYNHWFYWDGRRDSLWAQAITPLETPGEMDNTRVNVVRTIDKKYGDDYAKVTGDKLELDATRFPSDAGPFAHTEGKAKWARMQAADRTVINTAFANVGKILAAFIETLQPQESRFDAFVATLAGDDYRRARQHLTDKEQRGLKLFLDNSRTQCLRCHNGPLFTNNGFHNIATGMSRSGLPDFGRMIGLKAAMIDEFNCLGMYSDAPQSACTELQYADTGHAGNGAFKVPGLRTVSLTAPYMHDGRFATLKEVLTFYTEPPNPNAGNHELPPLDLTDEEMDQLIDFLGALSDPVRQ